MSLLFKFIKDYTIAKYYSGHVISKLKFFSGIILTFGAF